MARDNDDYLFYMHIIKGIGLYEKNRAAIIVASLGGNQLETEIVEFSENPGTIIFNSNLIWETSKISIKKMKTENLPIKIECFAIDWKNEQEVRTFIGYVLLPIRGIQISMHKKSMEGKPHWHKLLGVNNDWRSKRPEILLFFGITSKQNFINDDYFKLSVERYDHLPLDSRNTMNMLQSQQGIYIKLLQDEGLLQVGDSNIDCDIFIVKLMFKHAAHLEHIVNPEERMNKLFRLHYNLLGTPTYCSLIPKGDGIYSIQEKIAIHFKSSLCSLREYFNKILCIPIDLYYNETIVGHKTFRFINLIENDDLNKFQELHGDNNNTFEKDGKFYIEPLFDLPPTASNPFVEYTFSLRYMSTARIGNCEIIVDKPQIAEYIDNLAGGDNSANLPDKLQELPFLSQSVGFNHDDLRTAFSDSVLLLHNDPNEKKNSISYRNKFKQSNNIKTTKSVPITNFINSSSYSNNKIESLLMAPELPPEPPQPEPFTQKNDESSSTPSIKIRKNIPRTFSYNLILQSIKFIRRPEVGIWQISLHHLKADTPFTIVNTELKDIKSNFIEFKNLELQLFFASTDNQILNVIESEPCLLKIYGPRGIQAIAELDNEILLMNIKDKKSGVILLEDENGEKIAMAHIFLYLNDIGINFNSQYKKYTTTTTNINSKKNSTSKKSTKSSYFDENLAYKIVEELEEWKQKQQEQFLIELKRKEINHLAQLTSEWKKRKYEHETKLQEKLEQCSKLTDALEDAYNIVKEKGYDQFEQTRIIEQTRIEFEQIYTTKIIEFNEKIRRLENDTQHQLKLEQLKYMELEMNKNHIESENSKLKNEIDELKQKISDMQKTFLPREQLAGLFQDVRILSERLEEVQKSKDFYKEQWAKIIREVHNMKSEELKKMELHLRKTTSLGVQEFLMDEQGELLTEMEELNFVKSLINSNDDFTIDDSKEESKKFPKNEEKFTNWCRILNIDKSEVQKHEKAKVCSYHFKPKNIKAPRSKLSDNENKANTIVSQNSNENVVEIIQTDDHDDFNQTINTEENNTLFESPQVEITKSISDVIDTEDPLGISDNDDNDIEIDYNLLEKIKDDEMDFDDNDTKDSDEDKKDSDEDEKDYDDDCTIIEEVNANASVSQNSFNMTTRSKSLRSQSNSNIQVKNLVIRTSVKCGHVTKATNTPKAFHDEDKIKDRCSERLKIRKERIELLKKQFRIKQNQFEEIKNRIKELKKKKFENNRIMELLKNENEFKVAMQILLNLIENDDDYSEKSSFPKEIQELSTNLYTCSPQAYDLIRETFKNAFPSPQKIKDSLKANNVNCDVISLN